MKRSSLILPEFSIVILSEAKDLGFKDFTFGKLALDLARLERKPILVEHFH